MLSSLLNFPLKLATRHLREEIRSIHVLVLLLCWLLAQPLIAQKTVFSDNFNTSAGSGFTTSAGAIGSSTWQFQRSGSDFGARIHNNQAEITNSASAASNANGWGFIYKNVTSAYGSPFTSFLDDNLGNVEWTLNLRQPFSDPSGFSTSPLSYGNGVAYVLACTSPNVANTGGGYALLFGEAGSLDRMKLVEFNNGIQGTWTTVFDLIFQGTPDFGNEYFSFKIRYAPKTNRWFVDAFYDLSSFQDPISGGGTSNGYNLGYGTALAGVSLAYSGFYWQAANTSSSKGATFDNLTVRISPTEPDAAPLTYSQNFGSSGFSNPPIAFQAWAGIDGSTVSTQAAAEAAMPAIDATITSRNTDFSTEPTGGAYGLALGGNSRLAVATSADPTNGLCQPAMAIFNNLSATKIKINYDDQVQFSGNRTMGQALQYRVLGGSPANWTTISGSVQNYAANPTKDSKISKSLLLDVPGQYNDTYQFRWISWRDNASGSSNTTLALDNVSVYPPSTNKYLGVSGTPPTSGTYLQGATKVALQRFDLSCLTGSAAVTLSSIGITTQGTYSATDITNLTVYYSNDGTLDLSDAAIGSISASLGTGAHTIAFGSPPVLTAGNNKFLFITTDVSATSGLNKTISVSGLMPVFLGVNSDIFGTFPTASGNIQTIIGPPNLQTPPTYSGLLATSVTLEGNATSTNGSNITERGFYYSTTNGFANGTGTKVSTTGSFSAGAFSQSASSLAASTVYYFKSFATNAAGTVYSAQASFTTPKPEPTNAPTGFTCGTTTLTSIPLTWTDATGAVLPDGYLIKWNTVNSIASPTYGTPVNDDSFNKNVAAGVQSASIQNLTYNQIYYFKIFSYTNSGTNINYQTAAFGQTNCSTQSGQIEPFETGTKGSYATADVTCNLGSWNMNEALIGNTASDIKNGAQCVRMRNSGGYLTMNFDLLSGVSTVSVKHAKYGADGSSNWQLEYSLNGGSTWTVQGGVVTTSGTTLATQSYTVNQPGLIRFRIAKVTNNNRVNIDDILFTPYCSPPGATSGLVFSNTTSTGTNAAWGNAASTGTMLVIRPNSATNALPTLGTVYTANLNWASAGQIDVNNRVVFRNSGSSVSGITGLTAETQYTATAYNYFFTNCYQRDGAASASFWTLSPLPTAHAAAFSVITSSDTKSYLSFSAASTITNADGYILLQKTGSAPASLPSNGTAYTPGAVLGDALVVDVISSTSANDYIVSGLTANTLYYFELIPFSWNGANPETYNYRTNVTIPLVSTTTSLTESVLSDVITDATFAYPSNIDFVGYQGATATTTAGTIAVFKILVRDGGGTDDYDAYPTIPEVLFILCNTKNAIRAAGLFGGPAQTTFIASGSVGGNAIAFAGLSSAGALVTAPDGETIELTLRVTFKTAIDDNTQMQFSVNGSTDAVAYPGASSQFYDFPSEKSSLMGDNNRLEVIATKIRFDYQPDNQDAGLALAPFAITAVDTYNNIDLDKNSCTVTLTKSAGGGTMTAPGSPYTFVNGYVVVSDVSFSAVTTGAKILATAATCLSSTTATSNAFNITGITYVTGDYRSNGISWTTLSHWQVLNSSSLWVAASVFPGAASRVYIRNAMNLNGTTTVTDVIVLSGGTLTTSAAAVLGASTVLVKSGGSLFLNSNLAISTGFAVDDLGTVTINYAATNQSSLWAGTEYFGANSNFIIKNWGVSASPSSSRTLYTSQISPYKYAIYYGKPGPQSAFGNLTIDLTTNLGATLYLTTGASGKGLTNGTLTIKSTNAAQRVSYFGASTSGYSAVGGDLIVDATYASAGYFQISGSGSNNLEVFGNMNLNAANTVLKSNNGTAEDTISVYGNLNVGAAANLLFNEVASTGDKVVVKLAGDLTVNATGNLGNFSGTSGVGNYQLQFSGKGDGITSASTQEISVASTSTTAENVNIKFEVLSGSFVRIINQDFELGQNSELRIDAGATFDFGSIGLGSGLKVGISGSSTNTSFISESSSVLKITELQGLFLSGAFGNVRTASRTFNAGGTFWYIGKYSTQFLGPGLPAGNAAKTIICDLASSTGSLVTVGSLQLPLRSGIQIRNGVFKEVHLSPVSGDGYLTMAAGTSYKCEQPGTVFPNLTDFDRYAISQGTFEMAGSTGPQTLNNLPSSIKSLKISGTGTKTLSESIIVDNSLEISGGTLDIGGFRITGTGGLTMTGGTLKMGYSGAAIYPELAGTTAPYSLTGGTIELLGTTSNSFSQKLRSTYGSGTVIQYFNVDLNSGSGNYSSHNIETEGELNINGTCTVKSPTVFLLDASHLVKGTGTFVVNDGATLKFSEKNGLTPPACGTGTSCGQVRSTNRTFSNQANYWYTGNAVGSVTGTGLPTTVERLIINRQGTDISLSQNTTIRKELKVSDNGMLQTGSNKAILTDTATVSEQDLAHVMGLVETTRTLSLANHSFGGMGLEIDADGASPGSTVITRQTGITVSGAGNQAIKRKFGISPTVNAGLNATLVFKYFEDEINGLDENYFSLYRSVDAGITWTSQAGTVDIDLNTVTKTGINAFSEWTLGDVNVPLPLTIVSFTGKPGEGKSNLEWKVAGEKGIDSYKIMKSEDGNRFSDLGTMKAQNTYRSPAEYSIVDGSFNHSAYYTLFGQEGGKEIRYQTIFVPCNCREPLQFNAFPNPSSGHISLMANQPFNEISTFHLLLSGLDGKVLIDKTVIYQDMESAINSCLGSTASGLYQIHISGQEITQHLRIRKQ